MYKTIVVHVDGGAEQASRVAAAARLAREHDAHLIGSADTGISWMDFTLLTESTGSPPPSSAADSEELRKSAAERLDGCREQAGRLGLASWETRLIEDDARWALLLQSRYADLVVLSHDETPAPGTPASGLARRERRWPAATAVSRPCARSWLRCRCCGARTASSWPSSIRTS